MIDLTKIDDETLMARGAYSTVRAEHEDEKKTLSILCGELMSIANKISRQVQPLGDVVPDPVDDLIGAARKTIDAMELSGHRIVALAQQKHGLKSQAWGRT